MSEHPRSESEEEAKETVKDLDRKADQVQDDIDKARADWERKRSDEAVPGAVPPETDEPEASSE